MNNSRSYLYRYAVIALIGVIVGGLATLSLNPNSNAPQKELYSPPMVQAQPPVNPAIGDFPAVSVARKLGPAVVGITSFETTDKFFADSGNESSGSGVILSKNGLIVTNNHVVEGASRIIVTLNSGKQLPAKLVGRDPRTDLAVIQVKANNLVVAPLGDSNKLNVGEPAIAIGNPLGEAFARTITVGVISALNRSITIGEQTMKVIQTDAAINPGNSGGALVNARGELVGINSAKISIPGVEGIGFAIPISDARPIISELTARGYVQRPWLGIVGASINADEADFYKLPQGIFVREVAADGPAKPAGLRAGDVIIRIDSTRTKTFEDLRQALEKGKIGRQISLIIMRNGRKVETQLRLSAMPRPQ